MHNVQMEDNTPSNSGLDLLLKNLRKVLMRHGFSGDKLEAKIAELRQRDFPRLAEVFSRPRK